MSVTTLIAGLGRPRMAGFVQPENISSLSVAVVMGLLALTAIVATIRTKNI